MFHKFTVKVVEHVQITSVLDVLIYSTLTVSTNNATQDNHKSTQNIVYKPIVLVVSNVLKTISFHLLNSPPQMEKIKLF
jgi:hypothetical protein